MRAHEKAPPRRGHKPRDLAISIKMLGQAHGVTKALAKASITMAPADLWRARLAIKTLRKDQREAIAEAGE